MPRKSAESPWRVRQTTLEVSRSRLKYNLRVLRRRAKHRDLLLVLKSNAYGHGVNELAKILDREKGLHGFAVANVEEGIGLRQAGVRKPIYILSGVQDWNAKIYQVLHKFNLIPVITSLATFRKLTAFCRGRGVSQTIHLKINTGMNRLGVELAELPQIIKLLLATPEIKLAGLASHFASSDQPGTATRLQAANFRQALRLFKAAGMLPPLIHMEASSGLANNLTPEANIARIGLNLYGIGDRQLKPVARWKAQVYQVRTIKKGEAVGYGGRFRATRNMRMAVLGVGYADGFHRLLSNRAEVLLCGKRCRVLGSISMDLTAIDVTHLKQKNLQSKMAILLGRDGSHTITAEELAKHAETIPWEVMTSISARVPRVFVA